MEETVEKTILLKMPNNRTQIKLYKLETNKYSLGILGDSQINTRELAQFFMQKLDGLVLTGNSYQVAPEDSRTRRIMRYTRLHLKDTLGIEDFEGWIKDIAIELISFVMTKGAGSCETIGEIDIMPNKQAKLMLEQDAKLVIGDKFYKLVADTDQEVGPLGAKNVLNSVVNSSRASIKVLIRQHNKEIAKMERLQEQNKRRHISAGIKVGMKLANSNDWKLNQVGNLEYKHSIKPVRIKRNGVIKELPDHDFVIFGLEVSPGMEKAYCRIDSLHPNVGNEDEGADGEDYNVCLGTLEDRPDKFMELIEVLKTINLDSAYGDDANNNATHRAKEIWYEIRPDQEGTRIWTN